MKELAILLVAVVLIVIGTKGTYSQVWNRLFPKYPLVIAPPQIAPQISGMIANPVAAATSAGSQAAAAGSQAVSSATRSIAKAVISLPSVPTGKSSSNPPHVIPAKGGSYPVESIGTSNQEVLSTGVPSWWPSWLPYPSNFPHPGEGQTGQIIPNPFAP